MPRIRYSAEVRAEAVRLVLESQTPVSQVTKQFGCSANDGNKVKKKSEKSFFSKKTEFSLLTFCNIRRSAAFYGVKIGKIGDRIANIGQKISNIDTPVMNFDVKKCELRHSHRDRRDKNKNIDHSVTNSGMKCCLIGKKCCRIGKKTAGQMKA